MYSDSIIDPATAAAGKRYEFADVEDPGLCTFPAVFTGYRDANGCWWVEPVQPGDPYWTDDEVIVLGEPG